MSTIGSFEAKTHLPALLERVARGEQITITKRGVPIAMLIPIQPEAAQRNRSQVIADLREFGRGRKLPKGVSVRDLINEGRRF